MKRQDLIRPLEETGGVLVQHGGRHDWYDNPRTAVCQPEPRRREINEHLAKHILKKLRD